MSAYGLTADDIKTRVRLIFGNPTTTIWTADIILDMINKAYWTDICAKFDFYPLVKTVDKATVAGTQTVTFDVTSSSVFGCLAVKSVSIPALQSPIERFSWEDFDRLGGNLTTQAQGTPVYYYRIPDSSDDLVLGLFPTPDQAYTLRCTYRARPAALIYSSSDPEVASTATILPPEWDDVVIAYTAARLANSMRLFDEEAYLRGVGTEIALGLVGINQTTTSDYKWDMGGSRRGGT